MNDIAIIDIDGCLVDYPNVFLSWVSECEGVSFSSLQDLKDSMSRNKYEDLKHSYRISGIKRRLPLLPNAKETLSVIKNRGMTVWIVTTRPEWEPVASDTKYWLDKNNILYDDIFFVTNKQSFLKTVKDDGIQIIIDDEYAVVNFVSKNIDAYAFYLNRDEKSENIITNKKIIAVNSWSEIREYLKEDGVLAL